MRQNRNGTFILTREEALWQSYCAVKTQLKILAKAVLENREDSAIITAINSEGIIKDADEEINKGE